MGETQIFFEKSGLEISQLTTNFTPLKAENPLQSAVSLRPKRAEPKQPLAFRYLKLAGPKQPLVLGYSKPAGRNQPLVFRYLKLAGPKQPLVLGYPKSDIEKQMVIESLICSDLTALTCYMNGYNVGRIKRDRRPNLKLATLNSSLICRRKASLPASGKSAAISP